MGSMVNLDVQQHREAFGLVVMHTVRVINETMCAPCKDHGQLSNPIPGSPLRGDDYYYVDYDVADYNAHTEKGYIQIVTGQLGL